MGHLSNICVFNQSEITGLKETPKDGCLVACAMYEVQIKGHNTPSRVLWTCGILSWF